MCFGIVVAEMNPEVTGALLDGAGAVDSVCSRLFNLSNTCCAVTSFSYVLLRLIGKHDRIRTAPKPFLLGILDDRSRLVCHLQWYLVESAQSLVHGLSQAFMKRGLPRALMTDNGAAMLADEMVSGLNRLGGTAPDDAAVLAVSERQAGVLLGPHRGAAGPCSRANRRSRSNCSTRQPRPGWRAGIHRTLHSEIAHSDDRDRSYRRT